MSDENNEVEVILDTLDDNEGDQWEEDPGVKHKIAEIIDSDGSEQLKNANRLLKRGGFQVAYVSPFAGHVLGNAIQPPILRAELIWNSLIQLDCIPDSILEDIAQLREDLWRVGQSYCIREYFGKKDADR